MIFSISNIKKKDNNSSVDNRSLFELALENIKSHTGYKFITEAINYSVAANGEDKLILNKDRVKQFVNVLTVESIKGFKNIYENYILNRDRILNNTKNIISENALYKIDDQFFYNDYRFKYTNLRRVLSYSTFSTDINKESSILIQDISKYIAAKYIVDYDELLKDFKEYKENIEISLSVLCACILGKNGPVSRFVFASALYNNFREYRIEINSNIDKEELISIYNRFISNEKEKNIITNDFNKMIDDIANIESTINNIPFEELENKYTMNNLIPSYPRERIYLYLNVISMILDIYLMFFSARLDACLECLVSDIDILVEAKNYVENRQLTDDNKQ